MNIYDYLKPSNFHCQQITFPNRDLKTIEHELSDLKRRFPTIFTNLNIVLDFSAINTESFDGDMFTSEAKTLIQSLGHQIVGVIGIKQAAATSLGLRVIKQKNNEKEVIENKVPEPQNKQAVVAEQIDTETMIIEGSVRGGIEIYAENKSLVIIGDVKRGAEIASDRSITVFGKLYGRVHAGVKGALSSTITSSHFDPEVVSINGTFLGNQDIEQTYLGENILVRLNSEQNKLVFHNHKTKIAQI